MVFERISGIEARFTVCIPIRPMRSCLRISRRGLFVKPVCAISAQLHIISRASKLHACATSRRLRLWRELRGQIMFKLVDFKAEILKDNPTYERVKTSDLSALVAVVSKSGFTAATVAAQMRLIKADKWTKYARARKYLTDNIPALDALVGAKLVGFKTQSLTALPGGNIKHDAIWKSDSGKLQDLAQWKVRERVWWGAPSPQALPHLNAAYQHAGQHFGMGNAVSSPGSAGFMTDTHDYIGAWTPTIFTYAGPASVSYTCHQVYQYSDDNGANWHDIPNSTYDIIRTVTPMKAGKKKFQILKKNVPPNTVGESRSNSFEVA